MSCTPGDWDACRYHQVARPHAAWGASVLDRLELRGDEVVLDAGCGSGRVTAQLLERLPRGRVLAVDHSPTMLAEARKTLATFASQGRVAFVEADLLEVDRAIDEHVEVILSTAVYHWIADHPRLFRALRGALRPGGYMVAQCGGAGNLANFMRATDRVANQAPFAATFQGLDLWRFYFTAEETEARLLQAGFGQARALLEPSPQQSPDASALRDFCRAVVLTSHVSALAESLRDDFVARVVGQIATHAGGYALDYVRLNLEAFA